MYKICGIIAEYNPFHNGHKKHIEMAKAASGADFVVVVLSPNFVQRGEPAVMDKFARTRAALSGGADMVLELPTPFAAASAEGFAAGAVYILGKTGIVEHLSFGSENPNLSHFKKIAKNLANESVEFKKILNKNLIKGQNFPKARAAALCQILEDEIGDLEGILAQPNNILAIEYMKVLEKFGFKMQLHPTPRLEVAHHDTTLKDSHFASATAIRQQIHLNNLKQISNFMPEASFKLLEEEFAQKAINHIDNFSPYLHYNIKFGQINSFVKQNTVLSIKKAAQSHFNITDIVAAAKTKNITHTALKRAVLHMALATQPIAETPPYIRILGFRRQSQHLVSLLHENAGLPVITNLKNTQNLPPKAKQMLNAEIKATELYWLTLKNKGVAERPEISAPMVII